MLVAYTAGMEASVLSTPQLSVPVVDAMMETICNVWASHMKASLSSRVSCIPLDMRSSVSGGL